MVNPYYVYDTLELAQAALTFINTTAGVPLPSVNMATGALSYDSPTTTWAVIRQRLDGKYVFPKVPDVITQHFPSSTISTFNSVPYTLEEYSSGWFPVETEE
jgi:hypothetical protein